MLSRQVSFPKEVWDRISDDAKDFIKVCGMLHRVCVWESAMAHRFVAIEAYHPIFFHCCFVLKRKDNQVQLETRYVRVRCFVGQPPFRRRESQPVVLHLTLSCVTPTLALCRGPLRRTSTGWGKKVNGLLASTRSNKYSECLHRQSLQQTALPKASNQPTIPRCFWRPLFSSHTRLYI